MLNAWDLLLASPYLTILSASSTTSLRTLMDTVETHLRRIPIFTLVYKVYLGLKHELHGRISRMISTTTPPGYSNKKLSNGAATAWAAMVVKNFLVPGTWM